MALVIDTKYGRVEGFVQKDLRKWYGIPYAKPPIDDLRFRRAVECEPWKDIKECKEFKSRCLQFKTFNGDLSKDSEDCLYLNIWRKNNDETKLPVYVWIHGGYLHSGSGKDDQGDAFARDGVIFVNFNYRLGPVGCYDFSIYDKKAFDSNCCLSDEIMALKWIKENIEAFGGDPDNITINGQDAGATSVIALMACPSAKGLFHKAIAQSANPDGIHFPKSNKILMNMYLEHMKIKPGSVEKIKELDYYSLVEGATHVFKSLSNYPGIFWPGFVYDDLLPADCYSSLKNGSANGVKLIIGYNKNECTLYNMYHECPKGPDEIKTMFKNNKLGEKYLKVEDYYLVQKKGGDSIPYLNFAQDYMFTLGAYEVADAQSQKGDVWLYRFDYVPPSLIVSGFKATHGIEVSLTLDRLDKLWLMARPSSKKSLVDYIHGSWVRFAKTGNPNSEQLSYNWENYDSKTKKILLIDKEPKVVENLDSDKFELWNTVGTHQFYKN